jgi:hypothetical protein
MEENIIPRRVLYMNLETTRPRGRPRNRWQDEVREDRRTVGGEEWQEKYITKRNEESPENGKDIIYQFRKNNTERQTKKQMAR